MNLTTIDIPVGEAKARLAEYQAAVREERNAEDEAIAAGYRAAARGLPIIRLSEAVEAGGWFEDGLPRIAVIRADANAPEVPPDSQIVREVVGACLSMSDIYPTLAGRRDEEDGDG